MNLTRRRLLAGLGGLLAGESADLAGGAVPYGYPGTSVIAPVPDRAGWPQAASGSRLYPLLVRRRA